MTLAIPVLALEVANVGLEAPARAIEVDAKRVIAGYGFWIFLLSDIVMFSALFAAYAVLVGATAGGPGGPQLFSQTSVAIETACLLASSYTCGLMSLAVKARRSLGFYLGAALTFAFGPHSWHSKSANSQT